ncbi:hypothetical protein EVG20_g7190 [Dentipellis fragilis]|uniref:Chitinase n=1 Tax=Dentipellis fragilis TaxID=205917 RepID=A0A4Y9YGF7_9AGAM|nr:hypothetical protein EVG20_g7190 [Dentipellis fragilis]
MDMLDTVSLPIEQFFKANLPPLPTGLTEVLERSLNLSKLSAVVLTEDKDESLRLICRCINETFAHLGLSGYVLKSTSNYPERGTGTAPPDLCMYRTCDEAAYSLAKPEENANRADFRARTAWAHIVSFLQVEIDYPMDASEDESLQSFERDSPQPSWDSYAAELLCRQHRSCTKCSSIRRGVCPVLCVLFVSANHGGVLTSLWCQDNNYCGLDQPDDYNFDTWDNWARTQSSNKNIKVFIGAAASSNAAGQGYVGISTLENYATDAQDQYKSFGGVMLWDASEAYTNNRYDKAIKNAMTSHAATLAAKKGGSSKSTPPPVDDASQSDPKAIMWAEEEAGIKPEEKPHVKSRFFRD